MDGNRARGFLNASPAPEHLNSGFMQMSCHLLRQGGCTPLNRRTSPLGQGASLRQREIRTHARQALASNEEKRHALEYILSEICRRKYIGVSLVGKVLVRVIVFDP